MWSPRNRSPASPAAARAPRAATRSFVLDPAVSMVSLGPQGHHNRPTGDPCPLASGRLPSVLALEIPLPWRPATDRREICARSSAGSARTIRCGELRAFHGELLKLGFEVAQS